MFRVTFSLNTAMKMMLYIYSKINIHHRLNMQIGKIAQTFSLGQFNSVFQYLTEDIEWHIIGEQHLKGMDNIINHCNLIQDYFNKTPHKFTIHAQYQSSNTVIIQGYAEFQHSNKNTNIQACDIYTFNQLQQLTLIESYCITT